MSKNISRDIRTLGYVLKRTNYGEADRILNIITPMGKITAIAKGVRKTRSKLAGGIEMFSLVDFNIHVGRSEFGTVTGAKMMRYYGEIMKDFGRLELAGMILKKVSRAAEGTESAEYFELVDQSLSEINTGMSLELIEGWFLLNIMRIAGEEMNLYRDATGEKLKANVRYNWDEGQMVFVIAENGAFGANEIKMLRLMVTAKLSTVKRVKIDSEMIEKNLRLIRMVSRV